MNEVLAQPYDSELSEDLPPFSPKNVDDSKISGSSEDLPPINPTLSYRMDKPRMGHAVIINNVERQFPQTMIDVEAMTAAYKELGFHVTKHENCTSEEMADIRDSIMIEENHENCNCFAFLIISHGNEKGSLLGADEKPGWNIESFVEDLSDVKTLTGKPKLLTIQACRGEKETLGYGPVPSTVESKEEYIFTAKADMFISYSTVQGYIAHAGSADKGSIYLQAYAELLTKEYMYLPLHTILKMVRQNMVRQKHGSSGFKICSEDRTSLIYDVRFSEFHKKKTSEQEHSYETPHKPLTKTSEGDNSFKLLTWKDFMLSDKPKSTIDTSMPDSTQDKSDTTDRDHLGWTRICTGPTPGTIVTYGKTSEEEDAEFEVYDVKLKTVKYRKTSDEESPEFTVCDVEERETVKPRKNIEYTILCEHDVDILAVSIHGKDLLAVSCTTCTNIKLMDIASKKAKYKEAIKNKELLPALMCHGKPGEIYCVNPVKEGGKKLIKVLDCTKIPFSLKGSFIISDKPYTGLTYDPVNDILVFSDPDVGLVRSYSGRTGHADDLVCIREPVRNWKVSGNASEGLGKVSGRSREGLVYSHKQKVVIVCADTAIVVLKPTKKKVVQVIEQVNKDHRFIDVCICDDIVVVLVLDSVSREYKLCLYPWIRKPIKPSKPTN